MKYKAVIFDLDGTLFDHYGAARKAIKCLYNINKPFQRIEFSVFVLLYDELLNHYYDKYLNNEITYEQQRIYRIKELYDRFNINLSNEQAYTIFLEYLERYKQNWQLYSGTNEVLAKLKASKYKIGLLTNGESKQQREKIKTCCILHYFDSVIISDEVGFSKPDIQIFNKSINSLGIDKEDAIFIGDSLRADIDGANNADIDSMHIIREHNSNTKTPSIVPKYRISELSEIFEIIN